MCVNSVVVPATVRIFIRLQYTLGGRDIVWTFSTTLLATIGILSGPSVLYPWPLETELPANKPSAQYPWQPGEGRVVIWIFSILVTREGGSRPQYNTLATKVRGVLSDIRRFLVHSNTEYRPIESPISHLCRI